jgi:hypothetical protein
VSDGSVSFTPEVIILAVTAHDEPSFKGYEFAGVVKFVFINPLSGKGEDALGKMNDDNPGAVLIV